MDGSSPDRPLRDELLRLETALAERDQAAVPGGLADLIADDFVEFGASGRTWTAATIRELLASGPSDQPIRIEDFTVHVLGRGVVLATFRVAGERPSNRASIWLRRGSRWVIRFHQGTPRAS